MNAFRATLSIGVLAAAAFAIAYREPRILAQTPVPTGFTDEVALSGLTRPTAVRFAPDGRVFVAEKSGVIKVFQSLSATTSSVLVDLRTNVHNYWDRGLLSIALDPAFPTRPYLYVLYSYDGPVGGPAPRWGTPGQTSDPCPDATTIGCEVTGRLSRFELSGNSIVGSEQVVIHDWFQQFGGHSLGDLVFGPDGELYASAGEGASYQFVDYGQNGNPGGDPPVGIGGVQTPPDAEGGALRSQDVRTATDPTGLSGTVIRINPNTGAALSNNPMYRSTDLNTRLIVGFGFRNPYRLAVRPGTREIWVADVGWRGAEEINRIADPLAPVKNFGWPCYEGTVKQSGFDSTNLTLCEQLYAAAGVISAPYYQYVKGSAVLAGDGCPTTNASVTGLAFYRGGRYPARYDGALFFADYTRRCIWVMFTGSNGLPDPATRTPFITSAGYPVDLQVGPEGDLFYVDHTSGTIRRISYTEGNTPPVARITATPTSGAAPLTVQFSGESSSDVEDATLRYDWDLTGDGVFGDATLVAPSHTYSTNGTRTVRLRVTDSGGLSDVETVQVTVGNTSLIATIDTPSATTMWRVGQVITFSGHATDAQQVMLPASALTWSLVMNHCGVEGHCHEHLIEQYAGVASGSFTAPDHEYPSHLMLTLTARDSGGLQHTMQRRLDPETVSVALATTPSGLQLGFGGDSVVTPQTKTAIVGSTISLSAPSPQTLSAGSYRFASWSDGGAQAHDVVVGATAVTYNADFVATQEALPAPWSSSDVGAVAQAGSATSDGVRFVVRGGGTDIWEAADAFHYVHRRWTGDGEIVVRVASLPLPLGATFAMGGIMFRESLAANARHVSVLVSTEGKLKFRRRATVGGDTVSEGPSAGSVSVPHWLKLRRVGNEFTAYRSVDGRAWTRTGSVVTITMAATIDVGMFALRKGGTSLATATLDNVLVTARGWSSDDVGGVGVRGSVNATAASLIVSGGGTDMWSTADAFHFASTTWTGDGDLVVRVASLVKPADAAFAMAGITFRESLAANARHGSLLVSSEGKLKFRWRTEVGGTTASEGPRAGSTYAPRWLKLSRRGNVFRAFASVDGSTWAEVHTAQSIALPAAVQVGAWTLRSGGSGVAAATFTGLAIGPAPQ